MPKQIADILKGRLFNSFDDFRRSFWTEVANAPILSKQFSPLKPEDRLRGLKPEEIEDYLRKIKR